MLGKLKRLPSQLLVRRCVACGYDGSLLRMSETTRCPRCGCDLSQRPARSYAEMEGLLPYSSAPPAPSLWPRNEVRLRERWLVFMFFWAVLLGAIACLSFAALGSV